MVAVKVCKQFVIMKNVFLVQWFRKKLKLFFTKRAPEDAHTVYKGGRRDLIFLSPAD